MLSPSPTTSVGLTGRPVLIALFLRSTRSYLPDRRTIYRIPLVTVTPIDPNLIVAVGDYGMPALRTIEPRHDTYFIGSANDERVLDLINNNVVVYETLDGCTTQRWDLDPVQRQYYPAFQEGMKYLIGNHSSGRYFGLSSRKLEHYDKNDGRKELHVQEDGGTAIHSENCDLWLANGFGTSTSEHSYRFIAADVGSKYYFICPDMESDPPQVIRDLNESWRLDGMCLEQLNKANELQMWELILKE